MPRLPVLIAGWTLAVAGLVLAINAAWYPSSRFASEESWLRSDWHGLQPSAAMLSTVAIAVLLLVGLALWRAGSQRKF